jgi:hypothetical protein
MGTYFSRIANSRRRSTNNDSRLQVAPTAMPPPFPESLRNQCLDENLWRNPAIISTSANLGDQPCRRLPWKLRKCEVAAVTAAVNCKLLQCRAIFAAVDQLDHGTFEIALRLADEAFELATTFERYELQARVQFHRGNCFYSVGHWKAAHACYVRAASIRSYPGSDEVEYLTKECLKKLQRPSYVQSKATNDDVGELRTSPAGFRQPDKEFEVMVDGSRPKGVTFST